MRPFVIIASLIFIACTDTPKKVGKFSAWSEEQKRKFYTDSFSFTDRDFADRRDSITSFQTFMNKHYPDLKAKNKFDAFFYALEELYIDTTQIDSSRSWFRLTVEPCFRRPYCFIVEKKDGHASLTTKITNGDGCYNTGMLISTTRFPFVDSLYDNVLNQLNSQDFWKLGKDTTCGWGFDGENWIFEAIENGRYNIVERWCPTRCGNNTTKNLSKIGIQLGQFCMLDDILKAIDAPKSGM